MSREILFRGKMTDNGEWEVGGVFSSKNYTGIIVNAMRWVEVDPETVCQYTGLTDKNGRKIFEGDIVKHFNRSNDNGEYVIGCIKWSQDSCKFINEHKDGIRYSTNNKCIYEVIGNIFDNNGLLEGE